MEFRLEVVVVPVTDADRALAFYRDQVGFPVDVDYRPNDQFQVIQLTPPGSSCSIQLGSGDPLKDGLILVVEDLDLTRRELIANGVPVGPAQHKADADWQGDLAPGLDPDRRDCASFADFTDPDGNRWTLQERGFRPA
jgi:catechol 2,3-dioxygenase-like lactoylglutathione lyase family enzyme